MTTYALAHLHNVTMGPQIVAYLEGIDATMAPFGGKFVIHGDGNKRVLEGSFASDVIMLSFPTRKDAEDWYASEAYRAILPLRTLNSVGDVLLIDGVDDDHKATDILKKV
ncbi:uncharacterized protein (DUF1330 family) [Shinella sp. BE166]|uniref:DUF1330 domain-containing protein n=1 Tax=Shinella sp. BE166 TaxID=3373918 RepID=UPI003EBD59BB